MKAQAKEIQETWRKPIKFIGGMASWTREFNLLAKKESLVPGTLLTFDNEKWWSGNMQFRSPKLLFYLIPTMLNCRAI